MITEQAQPQTGPRDAAAGTVLSGAQIVATDVSAEEYMQRYAATYHEWIAGVVIKMSPASIKHDFLSQYLLSLFGTYLSLRPIGTVLSAPSVLRLPNSRREPDLMVVFDSERIRETHVEGPADLVVEIVSPSNEEIDYGAKLREYEAGGVREYWIIDPMRRSVTVQRLADDGRYKPQAYATGDYTTPLLPELVVSVDRLWQDPLPNLLDVVAAVRAMLGEN